MQKWFLIIFICSIDIILFVLYIYITKLDLIFSLFLRVYFQCLRCILCLISSLIEIETKMIWYIALIEPGRHLSDETYMRRVKTRSLCCLRQAEPPQRLLIKLLNSTVPWKAFRVQNVDVFPKFCPPDTINPRRLLRAHVSSHCCQVNFDVPWRVSTRDDKFYNKQRRKDMNALGIGWLYFWYVANPWWVG